MEDYSAPRLPCSTGQSAEQQKLNEAVSGGYRDSLRDMLAANAGGRVVVDFLVGTSNVIRKEGTLYLVGVNYIVLFDERTDSYTVCNIYSIEFVTFLGDAGGSAASQLSRTALKRV